MFVSHEFPIPQEIISVELMAGLIGLTYNVICVLFYLCTKETPKISVSDETHPVNCNITHSPRTFYLISVRPSECTLHLVK